MSANLAAALAYAVQGWPVLPCHEVDRVTVSAKAPIGALVPDGFKNATTDQQVIVDWWIRSPNAAIGVPTGMSTFDVLDVDVKEDGTGFPALGRLARAGLVAGAHRLVRTPSGGVHLYFRPSGNSNSSLRAAHLDVRGDGGYVIVPPSIVNGAAYVIDDDRPDAQGTLDWTACRRLLEPRRLRQAIQMVTGPNIDGLARWLAQQPATAGGRNNALFWACCRAVEDHGAAEANLEPLVAAAIGLGLPEREARRTAKSAADRLDGAA